MTKLQEIQQSLKKGIVESPRLLWALSAAAFTRVKSANDKMLAAFIATKNAQRPTRAYSNFTGQQQIDYAENTRAAKELVDSIDALVSYMKNATEYTPDAEYFLAESDDYDTAVLNKAKFDVVSSRPWGNFDSGSSLAPLITENVISSVAGPFIIAAPITYTVDGENITIPPSSAYVRSKTGPFTLTTSGALVVTIGETDKSASFVAGTYTAAQVASILDAADIPAYAEENVVTINASARTTVSAGYVAQILGFPIGTTRTGALFTDCDDIAELLNATVTRSRDSYFVEIANGLTSLPNGIVTLISAPFGTYRIKNGQVLPYLGGSITNYSGPGWLVTESLVLSSPTPFTVSSSGADPLGIVGDSSGESNILPDAFAIVPYVGDKITAYYAGLREEVTVTKVLLGKRVTVNNPIGPATGWRLFPKEYGLGKNIQAIRASALNIYALLNVPVPSNQAESDAYKEALLSAESVYQSIRGVIGSSCAEAQNKVASSTYTELRDYKYDLAADTLAKGNFTSFFLLNDITASSAKMLSVYRSSL